MPPKKLCALYFKAFAVCMPPKKLCALHFKGLAVCMPPKQLCALRFKALAICMPPKQLCALQWRYGYRRNQTGGNPPTGEQNPPRDPEIVRKLSEGLQYKPP